MHPRIAVLGTNQSVRVKMDEVYNWFVEKITITGGSYQVPKLSVLAQELGISDNTLGRYLKRLVNIGLLAVDKTGAAWRYATYRLPDSIIEPEIGVEEPEVEKVEQEAVDKRIDDMWKASEKRVAEDEEKVEEVSEVELVPYIEGHARLILNERRILDFDLAPIYGVGTGALNRAYKRNIDMFEDDWVIQLDDETWGNLCQFGIGSSVRDSQKHREAPPLVYNAEGANSVAFQLKQSPIARKRAKTIIKVFSDLERMAHGEEPKQPGFAEMLQANDIVLFALKDRL